MGNNTNKPLRENNMSYKHKTIIIAIAAVTSSAIKLRSKNILDDIWDGLEDAGEWVEGAAEDVGDVVVEAAEGVGEAVEDVVDVTDELLEGMWEEVVGDAEVFEAAGKLALDGFEGYEGIYNMPPDHFADPGENWMYEGMPDVDWVSEIADPFFYDGAAALEAIGVDTAAMSAEEIAMLALVLV